MIAALAFYVFAAILIASAVMVVSSRNPVHSVLFLILAFFNAAALMLIAGAEFLAMILVIVYVGAVAVLFLFVVMMLDIDFAQLREGFQRYAPIGGIIGGILFLELVFVLGAWRFAPDAADLRLNPNPGASVSNTEAIGRILYTDYIYLFQLAGLVLLVAMIGAIVLTLRERVGTRRQDIAAQVARHGSVGLVQVPTGAGLREMGILRPPSPEAAEPLPEAPKALPEPGGHGHGGHH
jgi:NADH-quinone oxidoreductase subunit J